MKWWLGFFGVVALLVTICALFMFVIPLEAYSGAECAGLAAKSNTATDISDCLCEGINLRLTPAPVKYDYHLLRGELKAYQEAKSLVDTCYGDKPVRLFL